MSIRTMMVTEQTNDSEVVNRRSAVVAGSRKTARDVTCNLLPELPLGAALALLVTRRARNSRNDT